MSIIIEEEEGGRREGREEGGGEGGRGGRKGGRERGREREGEGGRKGGREGGREGERRPVHTFLIGGVPFLILRSSLIILLSFCSSALSVSSSTSSYRTECTNTHSGQGAHNHMYHHSSSDTTRIYTTLCRPDQRGTSARKCREIALTRSFWKYCASSAFM